MIAGLEPSLETLPRSQTMLLALGAFGLTFVASLAAVAAVVGRIPADYFRDGCASAVTGRRSCARWIGLILKNVAGVLLILLGLLLSLPGIPGQGLLTVLIGVMLLDFPGKRRLERRLVSLPRVLTAVNALRARFGKPALRLV